MSYNKYDTDDTINSLIEANKDHACRPKWQEGKYGDEDNSGYNECEHENFCIYLGNKYDTKGKNRKVQKLMRKFINKGIDLKRHGLNKCDISCSSWDGISSHCNCGKYRLMWGYDIGGIWPYPKTY
jgi:hypothetical protein